MQEQAKTDVWNADQYNKNSSVQFNSALDYLKTISLQGNEHILDIGCGDGKITQKIATLVPNGSVLGVDLSPSMLAMAEKNYHHSNLKFQMQDAQQLHFSQQFDLVTSFFCLQWVPNKFAVFQGIYNSLKPQGQLLSIFPKVHHLCDLTTHLMQDNRWKKYFVNYTDPLIVPHDTQYDKYAEQAGLKFFSYQVETLIATYPSIDALCNWLFAVTPHLIRLPDLNEKHEYIQQAVNLYLKEVPPTKEGVCTVDFTLVKLHAYREA